MILEKCQDPMGSAIMDYHMNGKASKLRVFSSQFDEDNIPVELLFRDFSEMSVIEQIAVKEAKGKILDVGAGSGCHSLALQELNKQVKAIDISPLSVDVMKSRGVVDAQLIDFYDSNLKGPFDTILFLMNGSGIIGKLDNIGNFFARAKELLTPEGCLLMDSSDLKYLYENEDGSYDIPLCGNYYGEIDYQMQYKKIKGKPFDWLYIDQDTLQDAAVKYGMQLEILINGNSNDYLAKIHF